ncbi:MAG: hypothetical protein OEO23_02540 [Gemmatimonadota bacterium]|nr:hypothetical protein [Gemmatimonadota bacterium]
MTAERGSGTGGLGRLTSVVEEATREIAVLRQRLSQAEARVGESDDLLREFVGGKQDPAALARRLAQLEAENQALRERLDQGRAGVERVLSRIQFLEDR